jgi:hypothetical protein
MMMHTIIRRMLGKRSPEHVERTAADFRELRVSSEARAVIHRDRLAVFHADRGSMFKANGVGAQIWEALANETPAPLVAEQLVRRYGITPQRAQADVEAFIAQLRDAGLVSSDGILHG